MRSPCTPRSWGARTLVRVFPLSFCSGLDPAWLLVDIECPPPHHATSGLWGSLNFFDCQHFNNIAKLKTQRENQVSAKDPLCRQKSQEPFDSLGPGSPPQAFTLPWGHPYLPDEETEAQNTVALPEVPEHEVGAPGVVLRHP